MLYTHSQDLRYSTFVAAFAIVLLIILLVCVVYFYSTVPACYRWPGSFLDFGCMNSFILSEVFGEYCT